MLTTQAGSLIALPLFVAAGFALGYAYFRVLRRQADYFLDGESAWLGGGLALLRVAVAAAVFWGIAQFGVVALLGAFAGFLAARTALLIRMRRSHD